MLHSLITLLTSATLLAHALIGCCWHGGEGHSQTSGAGSCCAAVTHCHAPEDAPPKSGRHVHAHDGLPAHVHYGACEESPDPVPCEPPGCSHSRCLYITAKSAEVAGDPLVLVVAQLQDSHDSLPARSQADDRGFGPWSDLERDPAARCRARLQRWLI